MKYNIIGLNELSKQVHDFEVRFGFDNDDVPLRTSLIHSEISEAFEAFRNNKMFNPDAYAESLDINEDTEEAWKSRFKTHIKDTFEDEIADSMLRLLQLCGKYNIDIEWHMREKMKYNETRGFKFGGKKF